VVDDRGAVVPEAREVLKICARQRLVVHTGHMSAEQALSLIAAAREEGCDRIVVTHAQFEVVGTNEAHMKKAAAMGAKMELCALGTLVGWRRRPTACRCSSGDFRPKGSRTTRSRRWGARCQARSSWGRIGP
jgi:hypothetical protein